MKYLKEHQHYNDRYDKNTVEKCLRIESHCSDSKNKNISKNDDAHIKRILLWSIKGERYINKHETIKKWMADDKARDDKFENTPDPVNIRCLFCDELMEMIDKYLDIGINNDPDKVIFDYQCKDCRVGCSIDDSGKRKNIIPWQCPKCSAEIKTDSKRENNVITTKKHCHSCGYKNEYSYDLNVVKEPVEKKNKKAEIQFRKDRFRFCLSDEDGMAFAEWAAKLDNLSRIFKESAEKKKNAEVLSKIKKLKISEVEKMLKEALEKEKFIKLNFSSPDMKRDVIVEFTVQDSKDRMEYDSKIFLKKLIKQTLQDTNWRLIGEGLNYRLGILTGRLKGIERDEELIQTLKNPYKIGDITL